MSCVKSIPQYHWRILIVCCMMLGADSIYSQLNFKIGYTLGFYSPDVNNNIMSLYNDKRSGSFDQYTPLTDLGLTYGINLGARYNFGLGNFELSWESLSRSKTAVGVTRPPDPEPLTSNSTEFNYRFNLLMLTYESNFGLLGVGSSLGYNLVSINQVVQNTSDKFDLLTGGDGSNQFVARFHLSLNFAGNSTVSFAIKPFIQFSLTDIDLQPMANLLEVQPAETSESFPMWGLSFAFYNGRQ